MKQDQLNVWQYVKAVCSEYGRRRMKDGGISCCSYALPHAGGNQHLANLLKSHSVQKASCGRKERRWGLAERYTCARYMEESSRPGGTRNDEGSTRRSNNSERRECDGIPVFLTIFSVLLPSVTQSKRCSFTPVHRILSLVNTSSLDPCSLHSRDYESRRSLSSIEPAQTPGQKKLTIKNVIGCRSEDRVPRPVR